MKVNIGEIKLKKKINIGEIKIGVKKIYPESEALNITPTKEPQNFSGLFRTVNVDKIPDEYIIPEGTLEITESGEYDVKTYEKANVDVKGSPEKIITNCRYLFYWSARLDTIEKLCALISDNCTNFSYMFGESDVQTVPEINSSNGTNFSYMFANSSLKKLIKLDTSNGTTFNNMFNFCPMITEIVELNAGKATNVSNMFNCTSLTTFGGLKDLGKAYTTTASVNYTSYKLDLSNCNKLTHDSLMNIINNLYDIKTKGCRTQSLVLGSTNMAKLIAEEIAVATKKGWTVS